MALAAADAALVRRDPAVPGLGVVLDPEHLVAALGDSTISELRPTYVRYKTGTSCVVGYDVTTPDGLLRAAATAHRPDDAHKASKTVAKARVTTALGWGARALLDGTVVVTLLPNDRDLPVLRRLHDPRRRAAIVAAAAAALPTAAGPGRDAEDVSEPAGWAASDTTLRTLRYKPGRRWVGRLERAGKPLALLKVHTARDYPAALLGAAAFPATDPPTTPDLLGRSDEHHLLITQWIAGDSLDTALATGSAGREAMAAAGAALAQLHTHPAPPVDRWLATMSPRRRAVALADAAAAIGVLVPALGSDAARLAVVLATDLADGAVLRPTHGDCSPDQFVMTADGMAIVDLDAAALGDPGDDVGHMAAALQVAELDGRYRHLPVGAAWGSVLTGYGTVAPLPEGIGVHTAAWLLRLAAEPFRLRRPDWPARTAAILDLARRAC